MADTYTTNLNLTKPEPGAAEDTWGISLNSDLDTLDAIFSSSGTQVNLNPNQVNFADGKKSIFGTGSDLEIYHDGSNSYIKDVGTGNLIIEGSSQLKLTGPAGDYFMGQNNGSAYLYHAGSLKAYTTSTGINVTGTVVSDGLTVDGDATIGADSSVYDLTLSSSAPILRLSDTSASATHFINSNNSELRIMGDSVVSLSTNNLRRLRVESNGDIAFMDDTGTTQGLFWDASTERLGIGTTSPSQRLHLYGGIARFQNTTSNWLDINSSSGSGNDVKLSTRFNSMHFDTNGANNTAYRFEIGGSPKLFMDTSGNIGIGTTNPTKSLYVKNTGSQTVAVFDGGNNSAGEIAFVNSSTTGDTYVTVGAIGDDMSLSAGANERVRIKNNGSVGIGTTAPNLPLTILGDDSDPASSGATATGALQIQQPTNNVVLEAGVKSNSSRYAWLQSTHKGDHSSVYNMALNPNGGNVGIGTDSPNEELHLLNSGNTTLQIQTSGGGTPTLKLTSPVGTEEITANVGSIRNMVFRIGGSERARFDSSGNLLLGATSTAGNAKFYLKNGSSGQSYSNVSGMLIDVNGTSNSYYGLRVGSSTGNSHLAVTNAGNVGIGTDSPSTKLQVFTDTGRDFKVDQSVANRTILSNSYRMVVKAGSGYDLDLDTGSAAGNITFQNNGSEVARFDNSGNLKVSTTNGAPSLTNVAGIVLRSEGHIYASRDGGVVSYFNRKTNDGTILDFRKDGTNVGSIGSEGGDALYIQSGTTSGSGLHFHPTNEHVLPAQNGNTVDNTIDLGRDSKKFKDLHLSGQANVGTINNVGIKANETDFTGSILISDDGATGTLSSATSNTGLGSLVLANLTSGDSNVAVGRQALNSLTTGSNNTAVGRNALFSNTTASNNVAIGYYALSDNTTGQFNTAIGREALTNNTTASNNVAVGYATLHDNTTGGSNVALGYNALTNNETGSFNIGIGREALVYNTTAGNNIAVGYQALLDNTTGASNIAVGNYALSNNTTNSSNIAIGHQTLQNNTTGFGNTAVGTNALRFNTTSSANAAFGYQALFNNTSQSNTAVGYTALFANTSGSDNTAVGRNALVSNTTGAYNTAVGKHALDANTTGTGNTAVGTMALDSNTTASDNTAVGYHALFTNTTGGQNIAIGRQALYENTTAAQNTAVGYQALKANTTGQRNIAMGNYALQQNTTANDLVAIGYHALIKNTTGGGNVAVGKDALRLNTTASNNTAVGYQALENNTGSDNTALGRDALEANTTGGFNVAIGKDAATANTTSSGVTAVGADALKFATGSDNTAIGKSAGDSITTGSNNTCIGYQADTASATSTNSITLGDANITTLRCNTQTISALSDARDKSNVEDLQLGVEFIKDLRPVSFTWDRRDGSQNGVEDFGFIAQELDAVQEKHNEAERLGLVLKDNPDKLEASYGKLVPMLVKAIQELSEEVEELKQKLGE